MNSAYIVGSDNADHKTKTVKVAENLLTGGVAHSVDVNFHQTTYTAEFITAVTDQTIITPSSTSVSLCIRGVSVNSVGNTGTVSIHFSSTNLVSKIYLAAQNNANITVGHKSGLAGETLKLTTPSTQAVFLLINYMEHA
jgi:hypothetical protein